MTTKQKIIAAAKDVFHRKGYAGARMQEIADLSGINKALLHYHFQNKKALFRTVLLTAVAEFMPTVIAELNSERSIEEKIERTVELYTSMLDQNPDLPRFVLNELHQDSGFFTSQIKNPNIPPTRFVKQIEEAIAAGRMDKVDAYQVIADIIGLCLMPYIARPMLQFVSGKSNAAYEEFLKQRRHHVVDVVKAGLLKNNIPPRKGART